MIKNISHRIDYKTLDIVCIDCADYLNHTCVECEDCPLERLKPLLKDNK